MQIFYSPDQVRREPVLAAVGELQFDVVVSRLEYEYGVKTSVERLPHVLARWIVGDPAIIAAVYWPSEPCGSSISKAAPSCCSLRNISWPIASNPIRPLNSYCGKKSGNRNRNREVGRPSYRNHGSGIPSPALPKCVITSRCHKRGIQARS